MLLAEGICWGVAIAGLIMNAIPPKTSKRANLGIVLAAIGIVGAAIVYIIRVATNHVP